MPPLLILSSASMPESEGTEPQTGTSSLARQQSAGPGSPSGWGGTVHLVNAAVSLLCSFGGWRPCGHRSVTWALGGHQAARSVAGTANRSIRSLPMPGPQPGRRADAPQERQAEDLAVGNDAFS